MEQEQAVVPLRIGIIAGTAVGSVVLSPILVFFEAIVGLIALASGGAIGAAPSPTAAKKRAAGTMISLGLGLLAGPVFYLVALGVRGIVT